MHDRQQKALHDRLLYDAKHKVHTAKYPLIALLIPAPYAVFNQKGHNYKNNFSLVCILGNFAVLI